MGQVLTPWEKDNLGFIRDVDLYREHHSGALPPIPGLEDLRVRYEADPANFAKWHPHEVGWFTTPTLTSTVVVKTPPSPPLGPGPVQIGPGPVTTTTVPVFTNLGPPDHHVGCLGTVPEPYSAILMPIGMVLIIAARKLQRLF